MASRKCALMGKENWIGKIDEGAFARFPHDPQKTGSVVKTQDVRVHHAMPCYWCEPSVRWLRRHDPSMPPPKPA
jgi:hypothetical protein